MDTAAPDTSFCVITDGRRPRKLRREIASIRALAGEGCEVLVGGIVPEGLGAIRAVPAVEAARAGRLGEMRNRLVERARGRRIVVCDDDLVFDPGFREGLLAFGEDYDLLAVRVLNPDGTRYWDWGTFGGPRGHRLLPYHECDPHAYVSGAVCVLRADVARRVHWDEERAFYREEDVDFSQRVRAAGFRLACCPRATVTHDDLRYRQRGARVTRMTPLRAQRHRLWMQARQPRVELARLASHRAQPRRVRLTPLDVEPLRNPTTLERPDRWSGLLLLVGWEPTGLAALLAALAARPLLAQPFDPLRSPEYRDEILRYRRPDDPGVESLVRGMTLELAAAAHPRRPGRLDRLTAAMGMRAGVVAEDSTIALSAAALASHTGIRPVVVVGDPGDALRPRPGWHEAHPDPVARLLAQPELRKDQLADYAAHMTASADPGYRAGAAWGAMHHVLLNQARRWDWPVVTREALRSDPHHELERILAYADVRPRARGWRLLRREFAESTGPVPEPGALQACLEGAAGFPACTDPTGEDVRPALGTARHST